MEQTFDLNESGIEFEEASDNQQQEGFDCEGFKGSFLMQMQKMTKPVIYQRERHNVYSRESSSRSGNFLQFVDQGETLQQSFTFKIREQDIKHYIVDFNSSEECSQCQCPLHVNHQRPSAPSEPLTLENSSKRPIQKTEDHQRISITLKDYKQQVKKKLQQQQT